MGRIDFSKAVRGEGVGEGSGVEVAGGDVGTTGEAARLAGWGAEQPETSAEAKRTNPMAARIKVKLRNTVVGNNIQ
jgi:hypothetical protein